MRVTSDRDPEVILSLEKVVDFLDVFQSCKKSVSPGITKVLVGFL